MPKARTAEGARNDTTFRFLCDARSKGFSDEDVYNAAVGVNAFNMPPLEPDELAAIVGSVKRYEIGKGRQSATGETPSRKSSEEALPMIVDKIRGDNEKHRWLGFNEFTAEIEIVAAPPFAPSDRGPFPRQLSEVDVAAVRDHYTRELEENVSAENATAALRLIANEFAFHPVREYLRKLSWDGKQRVELFLAIYFGASNDPFTRLVSRAWLVSMIARIMCPGAKLDTVIVLEGRQGIGKSEGLRALAGKYYGDPALDFSNKDAVLQCHGLWLVEIPELAALQGRGAPAAKAFFSTRVDRIRPPYGRIVESIARQFVFVGSTNEEKYLHDQTGNRRFLPCRVTDVDVQAIKDDRDQLFAEALAMYEAGVEWWASSPEELRLCGAEQIDRVERHPWEDILVAHLDSKPNHLVFAAPALFDALTIPESQRDRAKQTALGQMMKRLGCKRVKVGPQGVTGYERVTRNLQPPEPYSRDSVETYEAPQPVPAGFLGRGSPLSKVESKVLRDVTEEHS